LDQNDQVVRVNNFEAAGKKLLQGGLMWLQGDRARARAASTEGALLLVRGAASGEIDGMRKIFNRSTLKIGGGGSRFARGSSASDGSEPKKKRETDGTVVQWAACKDDQAADTSTRAMSWAFIKTVSENPNCTYVDALRENRALLGNKYAQIAQLSCGHEMNLDVSMGL
ncbi:hypothetical protein DFJ73DRAFT_860702, partial [Zopfochytrium polystomum]